MGQGREEFVIGSERQRGTQGGVQTTGGGFSSSEAGQARQGRSGPASAVSAHAERSGPSGNEAAGLGHCLPGELQGLVSPSPALAWMVTCMFACTSKHECGCVRTGSASAPGEAPAYAAGTPPPLPPLKQIAVCGAGCTSQAGCKLRDGLPGAPGPSCPRPGPRPPWGGPELWAKGWACAGLRGPIRAHEHLQSRWGLPQGAWA